MASPGYSYLLPVTDATQVDIPVHSFCNAIYITDFAGADPASSCYQDTTHTFTTVAGDYLTVAMVAGAATVPAVGQWWVEVIPNSGSSTMTGGSIINTVTTTAKYSIPGTGLAATATGQATNEGALPMACTAQNLYVVQGTANGGGVTTTFTLMKNGGASTITGTITSGSGTGSIAVDTTHTVSFVRGDLMQLKFITGSGTSGTIAGWGIQCN